MTKRGSTKQSAAEIVALDPAGLKFERTEGGFLTMRAGRKRYERIRLYRTFPLSQADAYVSVRNADDEEIGLIEDLSDLDGGSRSLVVEELALRYFTPVIERVIDLKEEFGYTYWDAETTAGRCRFTVRSGHEAVTVLEENRLLLSDVDGNRFELPDYRAIDPKHQRIIEALL
jgi:hypothetical protein